MIQFEVHSSSSDEIYQLAATRAGAGVRFTCNCPAGALGQACKHRLALLEGDVTNLSGDTSGIERLQEMVRGSKIMQRMQELAALDQELASLKKRQRAVKAALGREMTEGG